MSKLIQGLALATTIATSGVAQAAYIKAQPNGNAAGATPSETSVPSDNDYVTRTSGEWTADGAEYGIGDTVLFGYNLVLDTADKFKLTFAYLGSEASYEDKFLYDSATVFNNKVTNPDTAPATASFIVSGGAVGDYLDFAFLSTEVGFEVKNDDNNGGQFATPDPSSSTSFNLFSVAEDEYLISFDDGYSGDDNHDDMVIRVKASKVPEPGTLALLGLGLAGFALRRKSRA